VKILDASKATGTNATQVDSNVDEACLEEAVREEWRERFKKKT